MGMVTRSIIKIMGAQLEFPSYYRTLLAQNERQNFAKDTNAQSTKKYKKKKRKKKKGRDEFKLQIRTGKRIRGSFWREGE